MTKVRDKHGIMLLFVAYKSFVKPLDQEQMEIGLLWYLLQALSEQNTVHAVTSRHG